MNILDNNRSLAINIMLKQFKSGSHEILEALQNGMSIPLEKLKGLQRVLPTDEEVNIRQCDGFECCGNTQFFTVLIFR